MSKKLTLKLGQQKAFFKLQEFIDDDSAKVFILKGYAGTGKSTLVKFIIDELHKKNKSCSLLASTGRAAKILSNIVNLKTNTIHGLIYVYTGLNQDLDQQNDLEDKTREDKTGQLLLIFEPIVADDTGLQRFYIIDESSMISDAEDKNAIQANFGTGRLLKDLLSYDVNGKFIFVGDDCQLPPIVQKSSPALDSQYLKDYYSVKSYESSLEDVIRQEEGNDIIDASIKLRELYKKPQTFKWAKFPLKGYNNITILKDNFLLIEKYVKDIKSNGFTCSTLICFSNKQSTEIAKLIRSALGFNSSHLSVGDLLLVTQNNYLTGMMNGDLVVVKELGRKENRAGLTFQLITFEELYSKKKFKQFIILEILYNANINLDQAQQKDLLIDFHIRMKAKGIKQKDDRYNDYMMQDDYLNALRAVYGYALTCHKAQGGEWERVYLDIPKNFPILEKPYVYQWMYTSITRAKEQLFLVDGFWLM